MAFSILRRASFHTIALQIASPVKYNPLLNSYGKSTTFVRTPLYHSFVRGFFTRPSIPSKRNRDDEDEERSMTDRESAEEAANRKRRWGALSGVVGFSTLALGKMKWVLGAAKLTKMTSLVSMLGSSIAYGFLFGPAYGVGIVGLIAVHEAGHALVMKKYGIPFSPAVFIPFMGAVISMKDQPKDVYQDAMIAFGGPVLGSAGALATGVVGHAFDSDLLIALCDFGLMINLFNLLPIGQMDGGRISSAISPFLQLGGLGIGGLMIYQGIVQNPIFYLIMMAGTFNAYQRFTGAGPPKSYFKIGAEKRGAITVTYIALIAALLLAMAWNKKTITEN
eukprot:GSMAST32.ASY1.ANO1.2354.1 assembled CDS